MPSIQSRLGAGLLFSLLVAFSVLWLMVSVNVQFVAHEYIASRLEHDADTLLAAINVDKSGNLLIDHSRVDPVYQQPFSGHYYVLTSGTQLISSRSLWDQQLQHEHIATGHQLRSVQAGPEHQSLLIITNGYEKLGKKLTVSVAEDLNPITDNINQFQFWFATMMLGILLLLILLQAVILRYSLRPISKIHHELTSLELGKLDKLSTDAPGELRPLIDEVNHLLAILQQRLRRSRDALGDLAHAIKKPLTIIQQLTTHSEIPVTAKHTLEKQANEIYQLSDHILKRARLAGHGHTGALFSFTEDLPALIKTLDMMHNRTSLQLTTDIADDISCPIDRDDMLELLGNLLDNAYKWARNTIRLSAMSDSVLYLRIEDDGPGVNPDTIQELSKRGIRLDEKIEGHGFGLAIAADIINDYSGKINFAHSNELGGLSITIQVPLQRR